MSLVKHYSIKQLAADNLRSRRVNQYTQDLKFINSYGSIGEAGRKTNINRKCISYAINGKINTSGGFIWKAN